MSKVFNGVWGSFEYMDEVCAVIHTLQEGGRDYSVMSPFPHHELEHAMGEPQSRIPYVTLLFGGVGIFFGFALTSWMSLDWVLPVSAKPIVSIPAYTIFAFELMVLLGGVSTAVAIFLMGKMDLSRKALPGSAKFRGYTRFSNDRFGVVVRCGQEEADAVEKLMRDHNVEEVVREY